MWIWIFLDRVMMKKDFGYKSTMWMCGCVRNVKYSIFINGTPKGSIQATRGLRQGDPFSPFLFLIVLDVLSRLIFKGVGRACTFWEDQWVGERSICSLFAHLYLLSSSKNCMISGLLVRFENSVFFFRVSLQFDK